MGKAPCHKLEKWLLLLSHITHKHFDYYSTLKGCFNLKLFNRLPGMLRSMITLLNKTSKENITFLSGQESMLFTAKWQNKKTWKMSKRKSKTPSINSLKSTPFFSLPSPYPTPIGLYVHWSLKAIHNLLMEDSEQKCLKMMARQWWSTNELLQENIEEDI